jgi:hypothetical protein
MRIETVKVGRTAGRKARFAALSILGLLGIGLLSARTGLASPPDRKTLESVLSTAAQEGGPDSATALQWAGDLDLFAQGLARLLRDPEPLATLQAQMAASPLPENTVRLVDLLGVQVQGRDDSFGALLAREAGVTEEKLRATLKTFSESLGPITLFLPREEDRSAVLKPGKGRGRLDLQVSWDPVFMEQKNLRTLLVYDRNGKRTQSPVAAPPSGPVLVVSTENSRQPEAPPRQPVEAAAEAVTATATATSCLNPFLMLTGIYLVIDHEGWPRGKPEYEIFLADWDSSMPGNKLVIRPTTPYQFDGRYVTDAAGRTVYLPDVNDTGRWYNFAPVAMFAYNPYIGNGLYSIEDDSGPGVLKVTGSYSIGFSCSYFPGCTGSQCLGCQPSLSGFVDLARAIFGSGDGRYDVPFRSVGGAPLGTVMEADMKNWRLRYIVTCP